MQPLRQAVWATILATAVLPFSPHAICLSQENPPAPAPTDALAELHAAAKQARDAKDFATLEDLRLQRLRLIAESQDKSPWTDGGKALATADDHIKAMRYEQACATLTEAWGAFEKAPRGEPVFGDIALKLFEATQAAKAIYPDFNAVSSDHLRKALRLAADADPCQVEALVAEAFLAGPDRAEAFEPAPLRPSLRARTKLFASLSHAPDRDPRPLPWHAPVECLKAADASFVLDDLDYYHRFLDPTRQLQGVDRNGEPVHVVMGGSLLTVERDKEGTRRFLVADYEAAQGTWVRMTPRILRIQPPAYKAEPWRISEARLNADLRDIMDAAIAERQTLLKRRLLVAAEGLQGSIRVKADIRKILDFMEEPPKSREPLKLEEVFQMVQGGFGNYARLNPDETTKVAAAQKQIQQLADEWNQFKTRVEALRAAVGGLNAGSSVQPEQAAAALADFLQTIGNDSLEPQEMARAVADQEQDDNDEKPKRPAAKKRDASGPIQLSGQELRLKLSRQKEQYDLLSLFKLMSATHRRAIEQSTATSPPAPGTPDGAAQSREERARAAARERLAETLEQYDRVLAASAREKPLAQGSAPAGGNGFSLTLDQLLTVGSAAREMASSLRSLGTESDQTRFLAQFADTIEVVARPAVQEADMQRYCTKANRAKSWQVGRATWRVYDFPAGVSPDTIADMIDHCQRVSFTVADLDAAMARAEHDVPPADAEVVLRPGCTTPRRNRLVHDRNGKLVLQFLSAITEPCTVLFLDVDASDTGKEPPAFLADGDGPGLWLEIDGQRHKATVAAGPGKKLEIVIDFGGPQGLVPLGAKGDAFADIRCMTDRRGARIVRDRSGTISPLEAHFYAMTSKAGQPMTDRSVNYAIQDWLDLDRAIVNVFLPNVMIYAPSLPAWERYRREFTRPAPDTGWMWPAAQRAVAP